MYKACWKRIIKLLWSAVCAQKKSETIWNVFLFISIFHLNRNRCKQNSKVFYFGFGNIIFFLAKICSILENQIQLIQLFQHNNRRKSNFSETERTNMNLNEKKSNVRHEYDRNWWVLLRMTTWFSYFSFKMFQPFSFPDKIQSKNKLSTIKIMRTKLNALLI